MEKIIKSKQFNASAARQGKNAALRFAATFGLNPNSDAGFQALVQTLKDDDPGVRIMAASKLARVSSSRTDVAFKALESLADDKDADVRRPDASLPGGPDAETVEAVRAVNGSAQV